MADVTTAPATPPHSGHMIVCGNDPLTHRLALELIHLYGERITLIVPEPGSGHGPQLVALATEDDTVRVIAGRAPDETTLQAAGIAEATAFAVVMDDDAAVVKTALLARGLNAQLRLVLRVFNQRLGKRLGRLLELGGGGSTAVLSASDMAAPALVSAALPQRRQVIPADGGTLSVFQVDEPDDRERNGVRLALLTEQDSNLLPVDTPPASRADVTVIRLRHDPGAPPPARGRRAIAVLRTVFSRRLQLAALSLLGLVIALTLATWEATGTPPLRSLLLVLLDLGAAGNPAEDGSAARQVLQLLTIFTGVVVLGVVVALVLENLGTLRYGPACAGCRAPSPGTSSSSAWARSAPA
ncbi:NAD-binding protein [Streptacidiphilus monticola]